MIRISLHEALTRIVDNDPIEVWFQPQKGNQTHVYTVERYGVIQLLNAAPGVFEAGVAGQKLNKGVYVEFRHYQHGRGQLFISTKKECRLTDEELTQSIVDGAGRNLFSEIKPAEERLRQQKLQKRRNARYRERLQQRKNESRS